MDAVAAKPVAATNYAWTTPILAHLKIAPRTIVEVGSLHGLDALYLSETYGVPITVFEPDPINAVTCRENLTGRPNVTILELALSESDGETDFLSIDPDLFENRGASSLLEINFTNRPKSDPDRNRASVQKKVRVRTARFESLNVPTPDLLAMDVQGAELMVLKGFGERLRDVKAIALETSFGSSYFGGAKFADLHHFLTSSDFRLAHNTWTNSAAHPRPPLKHFLGRYVPDFDCLYVRD